MIELRNIRKTYLLGGETVHAVDGLSMEIEEHEFVAIIGASGSGKSTLMNIIGCLDSADEGEYLLRGKDITSYTQRQMATLRNREIGFVFQQFNLLQKLTALENVELPLLYAGNRDAKDRAAEALREVGLADRMYHEPNEMSGGQRQRVAVARAIVTNPAMILADEPTGNLDTKTGNEIMMLFEQLNQDGRTVVIVTHEADIAAQCRRIIHIRDGKIEDKSIAKGA